MQVDELTRELRRLAVQTGHLSVACLGCGHEHSCSVHGCQVLQQAADMLEELNQYDKTEACMAKVRYLQVAELLWASEEARTDLAKRLAAAVKQLHEVRSDMPQVHCRDCIYMHDRGKGATVCDLMNYVGTEPDNYCSRGQRRE